MPSDRFDRAKRIVAGALERPPEARAAYLDEACGADAALRGEVESLLAHETDTPSLLATGGLGGADWAAILEELSPERAEPAGHRIGPYEVVGVLGEGGMGTVYHARQVEPVRRDVAIKLIRRGMDSSRVVARFETERQTLAMLDHPGIARILDAGADAQGHLYFVMELVRGVPITDYADARRLAIRDRLALFLRVCQAVQHAHQKGVLHRDLKPSNVLVTEHDGVAAPKVIDFGVAKAIEPVLDDESLLTEDGALIGTPEYMSPEQAGVRPGGADTRSDVYSLGVLLFELLTGRRPYRLHGLSLAEIQRVIGTEEPAKPSTSVSRADEPPAGHDGGTRAVGEARSSSVSRLVRLLAGDLDNIVLRCLRKEPERRYAGVDHLAADIRRYLDGLPVMARGDTWSYRTGKFVQRHRVSVSVAAAAVVGLAAFAVTMTYQRDRARQAETRAADEAATALQVSEFLVGLFQEADPFVNQGRELTARALLDQGADRIEQELADQPAVQATLMATMSQAYTGIRVPDRAVELAERSLELNRTLHGPEHPEVATSLIAVAAAYASRSDQREALPLYREALAMRETLLPPDDPGIIEAKRLLALNLNTLAELDEAETLYRDVLAMTRRTRPEADPDVTAALQQLGVILHARGKDDEALEVLTDALGRARADTAHPIMTADILSELAVLLRNMERPDEAKPMYLEALEIRERTLGDHPLTAQSHNNYGVFLRNQGQVEEALTHLRRALEIHRSRFGEEHLDVGIAYTNLASALKSLGRFDEAQAAYESALASVEGSMGRTYWVYGQVQYNYGVLFRDAGRYAEAEPLMVAGYETVRDGLGADSRRALLAVEGIVELYDQWDRPATAATYRSLLPDGGEQ